MDQKYFRLCIVGSEKELQVSLMKTIGERFKIARESHNLTLEEMAEKIRVPRGYLSGVENGTPPPDELINRVSKFFPIYKVWLLEGKGEMNEIETIGKRIKMVRESYKLTQPDMAKRLSVQQGHLSYVENDKREPYGDIIDKILNLFPINRDWLLQGTGTMLDQIPVEDNLPPSEGLSDFNVIKTIYATMDELMISKNTQIDPVTRAEMFVKFYQYFYESPQTLTVRKLKEYIHENFTYRIVKG